MIQPAEAIQLLGEFDPADDGEAAKSKELVLALLAWSQDAFSRFIYNPGHITCTGVVLSPTRKHVLLVHHRRLDRWLLPGGHVEAGDPNLADTARREVLEETGASLGRSRPRLVGVDVHAIPGNAKEPLHLHHDLIFAFEAISEKCQCSEESRAVLWCDLGEFDRYSLPGPIRRSVARALPA